MLVNIHDHIWKTKYQKKKETKKNCYQDLQFNNALRLKMFFINTYLIKVMIFFWLFKMEC